MPDCLTIVGDTVEIQWLDNRSVKVYACTRHTAPPTATAIARHQGGAMADEDVKAPEEQKPVDQADGASGEAPAEETPAPSEPGD